MPTGIYRRTKEIRLKLSKAHIGCIGHKFTRRQRLKISKALIGNKNALGNTYQRTKAQKRKISKSLMGNKNSLGHKHSEVTKFKLSKAQSGKLGSNWQGGIFFVQYSMQFNGQLKRKIRKMYKNICQLCGKRKYGKEASVHHIDYNKKNCKENNLITLCRGCNTKVNTNREYWFAYFTYIKGER